MEIPCLKKNALKIFASTADQRMLLGDDIFLHTHYPLKFRRYRGQTLKEEWLEDDIVKKINDDITPDMGNRVFVLFGAAGSGKSESIRWIENRLKSINFSSQVFRISRTELDPVVIMQKLISTIGESLDDDLLIKWEDLKRKPVTLANGLVWNSLSMMLDSDETIIPISYKLRPLIEENLRRSFSNVNKKESLEDKVVELITLEELEDVIQKCAIPVSIDYEQLRKHLIGRFEAEVFGGYNFIKVFREVGVSLQAKTGKRPVLLIDDLVQSMNIYASELLDFFITLEEGNWDIIIGLTPAYFEVTKRGRELLTRISQLDTFDDRLYKLWLTDEYGNQSYTINEENASDYIRNYLIEYKKINDYECNKACVNYNKCISMQWGAEEDLQLTPLNRHFIKRVFVNLFKNKGQARHFVVTVGEYLEALMKGKEFTFLQDRVKREKCIQLEDLKQKLYIESFIPENILDESEVPKEFLRLFGFKDINDLPVKVTNLTDDSIIKISENNSDMVVERIDAIAIRDWLENKKVNKELMKPLRVACSFFLKEFAQRSDIMMPYISKPFGSIKRDISIEGCVLPLEIEGIDEFDGIRVKKSMSYNSFDLVNLKDLRGLNQQTVINQLVNCADIRNLIIDTNTLNCCLREHFERELGIKCEELAYLFYTFLLHINVVDSYPIVMAQAYKLGNLSELPQDWNVNVRRLTNKQREFIEEFFKDWFQLRDNFYDGFRIKKYISQYPDVVQVLRTISELKMGNIPKEYKIGSEDAKTLIVSIVEIAKTYFSVINSQDLQNHCQHVLNNFKMIYALSDSEIKEILKVLRNIKQDCLSVGRMIDIPDYVPISKVENIEEIEHKYPDCIKLVSDYEKLPIYRWYKGVKSVLIQTIEIQSYLYTTLVKKIGKYTTEGNITLITNDVCINDSTIDNMSLIEMISLAEELVKKSKIITKKLDNLKRFEQFLELQYIDHLKAFLNFARSIGKCLSPYEYQTLDIKLYCDEIKYFLKTSLLLLDINRLYDDCNLIKDETIRYINPKSLNNVKTDVCKYLIDRVNVYKLVLKSSDRKVKYIDRCNSLISELTYMAGRWDYTNYHGVRKGLKKCIEKWNINPKSKKHLGNIAISDTSIGLITDLINGIEIKRPISSFDLDSLKEVIELVPELADKVYCNILLSK